MGLGTVRLLDLVRAARSRLARYVGISGLGTNPTNPWCQHPGRPPLDCEPAPPASTWNREPGVGPHCFVCGLPVTHGNVEEDSSHDSATTAMGSV
jgi:hypothetical protein